MDIVSDTLLWLQITAIASVLLLSAFLIPTLFRLRKMEFNPLWAARSLLSLSGSMWMSVILIRLYKDTITSDLHVFHNNSTWCMLYAVPHIMTHTLFLALIYVLFDSITNERTNREIVAYSAGISCVPWVAGLGLAIAPWIKSESEWSVWTDFQDPKSQECTVPFALGIMRSALSIVWLVMTQRTCDEAVSVARNKRLSRTIRHFLTLALVLVLASSSIWAVSTVYIYGYPHIQQLLLDVSGILDGLIVHASLAILVWRPLLGSIHASQEKSDWSLGVRIQPRNGSLSSRSYKEDAPSAVVQQNNQSPNTSHTRRASAQKTVTYDLNRKDVSVSNV